MRSEIIKTGLGNRFDLRKFEDVSRGILLLDPLLTVYSATNHAIVDKPLEALLQMSRDNRTSPFDTRAFLIY